MTEVITFTKAVLHAEDLRHNIHVFQTGTEVITLKAILNNLLPLYLMCITYIYIRKST